MLHGPRQPDLEILMKSVTGAGSALITSTSSPCSTTGFFDLQPKATTAITRRAIPKNDFMQRVWRKLLDFGQLPGREMLAMREGKLTRPLPHLRLKIRYFAGQCAAVKIRVKSALQANRTSEFPII